MYRADPVERPLAADQPIINALNAVVKKAYALGDLKNNLLAPQYWPTHNLYRGMAGAYADETEPKVSNEEVV